MTLWLGVALVGVGLVLRAWALRALLAAGLSEHQILSPARPATYTDDGPYLFLDHPAYWGSLMILTGLGIAGFGWWGVLFGVTGWPFFKSRMVEEDWIRAKS